MVVYVIAKSGKPLMPTTPRKARKLLDAGKAKVIRRTPFTIKLTHETTEYTQPITMGVKMGSATIGSAAVTDEGDVLYISEITVRNDIAQKMQQRKSYRRNRRYRKTRYRKARWLNRGTSKRKERFSPTMVSKIRSHIKEIAFVKQILPITNVVIETAIFDPHALKNPAVLENKWLYQKGMKYGFANTKAYVLWRDKYTCRNCKNKSKDKRLEVHHRVWRSDGGADTEDNLITLCKSCHDAVHRGEIILKGGVRKGTLTHATQMNIIRKQLPGYIICEETFGFVTKEHRQLAGLPKTHYNDAIVIASGGNPIQMRTLKLLLKRCVPDGDYQQTKGKRSEKRIPAGKIQGFRKFDRVEYMDGIYFIKGRMATGYAVLMDYSGQKADLKPIPKMKMLKRMGARKSWIMCEEAIPKVC